MFINCLRLIRGFVFKKDMYPIINTVDRSVKILVILIQISLKIRKYLSRTDLRLIRIMCAIKMNWRKLKENQA